MSDSITFHHRTAVQIRFNDIDILGHVNNAVIQEYFDLGRMHYLRAAFGNLLWEGESTLIIANINTDFVAPVFLTNEMCVKTTICSVGNKSLKMEQHLIDDVTNQTKAICKSVMVAIHKKQGEAVNISDEWRLLIDKMEKRAL